MPSESRHNDEPLPDLEGLSAEQMQQMVRRLHADRHALQQQLATLQSSVPPAGRPPSAAELAPDTRTVRAQHMLEMLPCAVLLIAPNGTISGCNQRALFLHGYAHLSEIRGRHINELGTINGQHEQHGQHGQTALWEQMQTARRIIEHPLWRADGSHFLAAVSVNVLHDHQRYESLPGTRLCMVQDITAQRQHEAWRVEGMRLNMGRKLTNIIAHEVNTPLQTIISSLALMQDSSEAERITFMQLAQQEVARIGAILHRLKNFYHDMSDAYEYLDINQALDHVLTLSGARMTEHTIPIERDFAADLPRVRVSTDQFNQALLHLVLNALEAMPQGGRLQLASRVLPHSRHVLLAISDTGSGIAPEIQDLIFDPFFTTKDHAAGLGLFISQQIIVRHGGTLEITSQQDAGTRATILLPY